MTDCPWPLVASEVELGGETVKMSGVDVTDMSHKERWEVMMWLSERNTQDSDA